MFKPIGAGGWASVNMGWGYKWHDRNENKFSDKMMEVSKTGQHFYRFAAVCNSQMMHKYKWQKQLFLFVLNEFQLKYV